MTIALVLLLAGLVLLTLAADRFVLSAARLSKALGLSPILIGALVIGLGTSAPELLVSAVAAAEGEIDLAIGNVVGSNIANMTLVLGVTALVGPVVSRRSTMRREGGLMFAALVLLSVFLWRNLELSRIEGGILMAGMVMVALILVRWARRDAERGQGPPPPQLDGEEGEGVRTGLEVIIGLGALGLTLVGAEFLVRGASRLATELGISAAFVGLVIISVGTSLPEIATALAAARRNHTDLVLGNVLGSNLFNSLSVAGTAALIGPGAVDPSFRNALAFMLATGIATGFFVVTGRRLVRWEGIVLLAVFIAFVAVAGQA